MSENIGNVYYLRCAVDGCNRPYAIIQNGVLVIKSRHGGAQHVNVIQVNDLVNRLLEGWVITEEESGWFRLTNPAGNGGYLIPGLKNVEAIIQAKA